MDSSDGVMRREEISPRLAMGRQLLQLPACHRRWTMDDGLPSPAYLRCGTALEIPERHERES
jgi:hypothetical protein